MGIIITACVPTPAATMPLFPTVSTYYPLGSLMPRRNAVLKNPCPPHKHGVGVRDIHVTVTHLYKHVQLYAYACVCVCVY